MSLHVADLKPAGPVPPADTKKEYTTDSDA